MTQFLLALFSGRLNLVAALFTVCGFVLIFFPVLKFRASTRVLLFMVLALLVFVIITTTKAYEYYQKIARVGNLSALKIKLLSEKPGEGRYKGLPVYVLENPGIFRDNLLLTLYSTAKGIPQAIGLLQIITCQVGVDIQAISFPDPSSPGFQVNDYYSHSSGDFSLYAVPVVHVDDLRH